MKPQTSLLGMATACFDDGGDRTTRQRSNVMVRPVWKTILMVTVIGLTALRAPAENDRDTNKLQGAPSNLMASRDRPSDEPSYQGRPLSHWLRIIRDRNEEELPLAFDAICYLGPDAQAAVPPLTRIVTAPFAPIYIGKDSDDLIASKLYDIELRLEAIDALACIGEAASSATIPMINWAVTARVVPPEIHNAKNDERFIDLVTMDVEQRIQVVIAIAELGDAARPILIEVLKSAGAEKRKLAVAILGEEALTIAADLLRSRDCDDARLGITILGDMEPVVARAHLTELKNRLVCYAN
jgi:hypothetical protein